MHTRWSEADLTEFFGNPASYSESCESYAFTRSHRGIRLDLTLFPEEGAAYLSLAREGEAGAFITLQREKCSHARIVSTAPGRICLEVGSPDHDVTELGAPPVLARGLRLFLSPDIFVEQIDKDER